MFAYPKVTTAIPAIEKQNARIVQSPKLLATAMKRNTSRLKSRWLAAKRVEPPPAANYYKLKWKPGEQGRRQRIKVIIMLRKEGNLPYVRTHKLSQSAFVEINANENGGNVVTGYKSPIAKFVMGEYRQPTFDPAVGGIPWQNPAETDAKFVQETIVVIRETWKTVTDERAGVR